MTYPCKYCDKKLLDNLAYLIHLALMQGIDEHPEDSNILNQAKAMLMIGREPK